MKIRNLTVTPFQISFATFAAFQGGFIVFANWGWLRDLFNASHLFAHDRIVISETTFLIALVHLLVTANTFIFIIESVELLMHTSKLSDANQASVRSRYGVIVFLLVS